MRLRTFDIYAKHFPLLPHQGNLINGAKIEMAYEKLTEANSQMQILHVADGDDDDDDENDMS